MYYRRELHWVRELHRTTRGRELHCTIGELHRTIKGSGNQNHLVDTSVLTLLPQRIDHQTIDQLKHDQLKYAWTLSIYIYIYIAGAGSDPASSVKRYPSLHTPLRDQALEV